MTPSPLSPALAPLGDGAILVTLGDTIDRELNRQVHRSVTAVMDAALPEVLDVVPAYSSFAVHYDPRAVTAREITTRIRRLVKASLKDERQAADGPLIVIPVSYCGADLAAVAEATGLTAEEVVTRHAAVEYSVYMIGFSPGFAYLGELDPALRLPRQAAPRARVPSGSVAIAGSQTAVYPHETPGGWHLIGRTDLAMFDGERDPPALLRAGNRVRFERVP